jgi:surface antigen
MRMIWKLVAAATLALGVAGCASEPLEYSQMPPKQGRSVVEAGPSKPIQCVPYAREHSKIKIFGDANTWWDKADGKYPRGTAPAIGSVMVLHDYAHGDHGHVAVVRNLISAREIRVDHANWLNDGSIYVNNPVMDVSQDNDWSVVRVFNIKTGGWGIKLFPVQGFIGSSREAGTDDDAPAHPDLVSDAGRGGMGTVSFVGE